MSVYDILGNELVSSVKIQPYYESEMSDTIAKVRREITEPCLVVPVVTDIHRYTANIPQTFDKMVSNLKMFCSEVKCDFVINLGDLINGDTSDAQSIAYGYDSTKEFFLVGAPYLFVEGNHDNNIYTASGSFSGTRFTMAQVFQAFYSGNRGVTVNVSENGTDYYIDIDGLPIRIVGLNACNVNKAANYAYGDSTAAWLTNDALNTDKTILLVEHLSSIASQVWNNNHGTNADAVTSAIQAKVNNGATIIQLAGHSHADFAFIKPWLSVAFVCQKFEKADISTTQYGKISGYIDVIGNPSRTLETASEDAWTVCILKPESGDLDAIRFGAGIDRHFHYTPIAPATLTTKLSGTVTWSSSDTSVATVNSSGVVTGVASGVCAILAKDVAGNYEAWTIKVT